MANYPLTTIKHSPLSRDLNNLILQMNWYEEYLKVIH